MVGVLVDTTGSPVGPGPFDPVLGPAVGLTAVVDAVGGLLATETVLAAATRPAVAVVPRVDTTGLRTRTGLETVGNDTHVAAIVPVAKGVGAVHVADVPDAGPTDGLLATTAAVADTTLGLLATRLAAFHVEETATAPRPGLGETPATDVLPGHATVAPGSPRGARHGLTAGLRPHVGGLAKAGPRTLGTRLAIPVVAIVVARARPHGIADEMVDEDGVGTLETPGLRPRPRPVVLATTGLRPVAGATSGAPVTVLHGPAVDTRPEAVALPARRRPNVDAACVTFPVVRAFGAPPVQVAKVGRPAATPFRDAAPLRVARLAEVHLAASLAVRPSAATSPGEVKAETPLDADGPAGDTGAIPTAVAEVRLDALPANDGVVAEEVVRRRPSLDACHAGDGLVPPVETQGAGLAVPLLPKVVRLRRTARGLALAAGVPTVPVPDVLRAPLAGRAAVTGLDVRPFTALATPRREAVARILVLDEVVRPVLGPPSGPCLPTRPTAVARVRLH